MKVVQKIQEKISSISQSDNEYEQILSTILYNISEKEIEQYYQMLLKSEETGQKINIIHNTDEMWDSLDLSNIEII